MFAKWQREEDTMRTLSFTFRGAVDPYAVQQASDTKTAWDRDNRNHDFDRRDTSERKENKETY